MANTYTQLFIHLIFSPMHRFAMITEKYENNLYKLITGIVQNKGHKLICINGTEDHIHLLVGLHPEQSISSLVQDIKRSSSRWINENEFVSCRFEWQTGYGAFSHSKSQIKSVINYIEKQKEHHKKTTFKDEYTAFLIKYGVNYDMKYIFKDPI